MSMASVMAQATVDEDARSVTRFGLYANDEAWRVYRTSGAPVSLVMELYAEDWFTKPVKDGATHVHSFLLAASRAPGWDLERLDTFILTAVAHQPETRQAAFYKRGEGGGAWVQRSFLAPAFGVSVDDPRLVSVAQFSQLVECLAIYHGIDEGGELAGMLPDWLLICDMARGIGTFEMVTA